MRPQTRISLLLALNILAIAIFAISLSLISKTEDTTYLTPIPESTWSAYRQQGPITTNLEAVLAATREIYYSRMTFTQGAPKVVSAEKRDIAHEETLLGYPFVSSDEGPEITQVWLVVFEGQWQMLPPMSNDLLPLQTGCIYVILDANKSGGGYYSAGNCQPMP